MRQTILAALDTSAGAGLVLDTARAISDMLDVELEAIHVPEDGHGDLAARADAAGVRLRLLNGSPPEVLAAELSRDDVRLAVLGIRRELHAARAIGHIALSLVQRARKPVITVPPSFSTADLTGLKRVLVPLDGTWPVAQAMGPALEMLSRAGAQALVLHVFQADRIPRFSDQPHHETVAWEREFLARYCRQGVELQTRRGWASPAILEVAMTERVGMIALGWQRDLSAGRAAVVRDLLWKSSVPILLVPMEVGRAT